MSTKLAGNTAINDKIREKVPLVLKTEHADVEQLMWDEIYPNVVTDTESTTLVLTKLNTYFDYEIKMWKQGKTVHMIGEIRNQSGSPLTAVDVASIADGEFRPLGLTRIILTNGSGDTVQIKVEGSKISFNSTVGTNTLIIQGKYPALN